MNSLILGTATRFLMPLMLLFSVFLLLRGHNAPGGGFAGGLVAAAAFALYSIAANVDTTRKALRFEPQNFIGAGLLIALVSGLPGLLFGKPFMAGWWQQIVVPGFMNVKLGTPLLFDIGVYLVVLGVTLKIILPLEEQAEQGN
jgi:multicomponent Na+:H+ antiporter subunit B